MELTYVQKEGGEARQEEYLHESVPFIPSNICVEKMQGTFLISLLHHLSVLGYSLLWSLFSIPAWMVSVPSIL